jgi:four helix bundle protein
MIKTYRDFIVWQKSMDLVEYTYRLTKSFPKDELFGLTGQVRRASVSVPSNIAEGFGRNSDGDFYRFLTISTGSLFEIQTQMEIALRLNYIQQAEFDVFFSDTREIERMLSSLMKKLKQDT